MSVKHSRGNSVDLDQTSRCVASDLGLYCWLRLKENLPIYLNISPVSSLYKSIAGRYRSVRVADGPITPAVDL